MARRRITTLLLIGFLAAGATACGFPPNGGGGQLCIDSQEGDDPIALTGSSFSRQSTRCIDPDNDEDVFDVDPSADGELSVTCETDAADDLVHVVIDPSTGSTVEFDCDQNGETRSIPLDATDTAEVTFTEGPAGVADEGESYRLTIEFAD